MKIIDKFIEYFFNRKIKIENIKEITELDNDYYKAAIYAKLPFMERYCVWCTYSKDIKTATEAIDKAYMNVTFVKNDMSLVSYIDRIVYKLQEGWLNVIDIINDDGNVVKKSKGVFKKPVKKWYFGFGINKREFAPFNNSCINPILYINSWSLSWKPKYNYVCFEDRPQFWVCLFQFFWFGYKLSSPIDDEVFEDSYWEQMIWFANYSDCDLEKAEKTYFGKWDKKYLIEK